jgi:acetoin utilization deacetylase AcuC-like enzyme
MGKHAVKSSNGSPSYRKRNETKSIVVCTFVIEWGTCRTSTSYSIYYSPNTEFLVSPLATFEELATTHSEEYIQRFLKGDQTEREQRNVGFPWSQEGVDRASSSVGGTMAAACDVCEVWKAQQKRGLAPWGAHIAGGTHHAFFDRGEGFSVFSDIAVAANVVLERHPDVVKKILIVDLDVHQGNGNAVLFQGRPEVSTFSMQCEGNYFSEKQESDLDVELPIGCNDQTYLMTLNHWLNQIRKLGGDFDLIFFQAGVDVLEDDRLGRMSLSQKGVERRNELVFEFARNLNIPLVICMGGGYPRTSDWTPIIQAHANVYCQAHRFLRRLKDRSVESR